MKGVVNSDLAFVAEILLKHIPSRARAIQKQHIKCVRGTWRKVFDEACSIRKAKREIYPACHLQGCHVVSILSKKPLIGSYHGSDLRRSLKHRLWYSVIKHNLEDCSKVLASAPDVLGIAERFTQNAEYFSNVLNSECLFPKPLNEYDSMCLWVSKK